MNIDEEYEKILKEEAEAIAKELCNIRKINPDATQLLAPNDPRNVPGSVGNPTPNWVFALHEVLAFKQVLEAIKRVEKKQVVDTMEILGVFKKDKKKKKEQE